MSEDFSPEDFIHAVQNEVPSAEYTPTPEVEAPMRIKQGSTKIIVGEKDGRPWKRYTAVAVVDSQEARDKTGLENPTAQVKFFLDLTQSGSLDRGPNRNVMLGRLLKATGNDKAGWNFAHIEEVPFLGRIKHRVDDRDPTRVFADVVSFAKL